MMERHPLIGDIRGLGLFLGIELVEGQDLPESGPSTKRESGDVQRPRSGGLSFKLTMGNILKRLERRH